ncbi:hypothetical protein PGB90_005041 [Kerria lacca]
MDLDEKSDIICSKYVKSIEKTVNLEKHQNYIDRYFIRKYYIDFKEENNDHCVLIHSNRLCVITLAPSHPIVRDKVKINNIDFQISKNVNRLENKACGKRKRNAQFVSPTSPICFLECSNKKKYIISSPVCGKLLEINDKLATQPELLHLCYTNNYNKECYIAIIVPKHNISLEDLTKDLLTEDQYMKALSDKGKI